MVVVPFLRLGRNIVLPLLLGLASASAVPIAAQAPVSPHASAPVKRPLPHSRAAYVRLPLRFEANQGQAPAPARFLAHGPNYQLALTPTEAVFALASPSAGKAAPVLRMQLVGASSHPQIQGQGQLPGKSNYLLGSDPKQWHTDIPTYSRVAYQQLYRGVDLIYYGNQRQLEYDFTVAPKADPHQIALKFQGAKALQVNPAGELVVQLNSGAVRWHKPVVYQERGGKRVGVAGRYVLRGRDQVGFALARYDHTRPLVIDPIFSYGTYLGGSGSDEAFAITLDSAGNAYLTGDTTSPNFPGAAGTPPVSPGKEAFVTKIDPTGTSILYSTYLGGNGETTGWAIKTDASGNAYIAGDTTSTNLPVTNGFSTTNAGGGDAFLTKLNPAGNGVLYSTYLGGDAADTAQGVALGPTGLVYITGYTASANFPVPAALQAANAGGLDAFVAVVNTANVAAASLIYSTYFGGSGDDRAFGIAVDPGGRFYITGDTTSADLPTVSPFQNALQNTQNAFITAFSSDGTTITYSSFIGGKANAIGGGSDSGFAIAVDGNRNAYITGTTGSPSFPTRNAFQSISGQLNNNVGDDAFVAKFNTAATLDASLVYSSYLGGPGVDAGRSIAVDVWGNAYVAGDTDNNPHPPERLRCVCHQGKRHRLQYFVRSDRGRLRSRGKLRHRHRSPWKCLCFRLDRFPGLPNHG